MRKTFNKSLLERRTFDREETRDAESPLLLRTTETGERSFSVRTRLHGKQIRLTYPKTVCTENLSDARAWARSMVDTCAR